MHKTIKDLIESAKELSKAAGSVVRHEGLVDLQKAIAKLDAAQMEFMRKCSLMENSTCGTCPMPCGQDWCVTKEKDDKDI